MKKIAKFFYFLLIGLLILPQGAQAHLIGGNGLASGITHPLFGIDHLLAMIAVGIISTQIGGKAIWKVPATFIIFMVAGGIMAIKGLRVPFIETGIALSVLFFGTLIALSKKTAIRWTMACVAIFAVFHGYAHGTEMPTIAHPALYSVGFVLSTAVLHITGALIGHYAHKTKMTLTILRYAGAGMSMIGIGFLLGL
jgi:urease accessory protein